MSTDSLIDIVRAYLRKSNLALFDGEHATLSPMAEAFALRELVELVTDGLATESWDNDHTSETPVDPRLLTACREGL